MQINYNKEATKLTVAPEGRIDTMTAPELEKKLYLTAAMNILKALDARACCYDEQRDELLLMCSEAYVSKCAPDHNIIYGDFFYTEAILKLLGAEFNPW